MIKVTDKYYINADSMCYTVCTPYKTKDGEIAYTTLSYHGEMHGAVANIMKRLQREFVANNDVSLAEASKHFEELNNAFKELLHECIGKYEKVGD